MIASIPRARGPRATAAQPEIVFSVARLDDGVHVLIVDHPSELHVVVDEREMSAELAAALTAAVRANTAKGHWVRMINAMLASTNPD